MIVYTLAIFLMAVQPHRAAAKSPPTPAAAPVDPNRFDLICDQNVVGGGTTNPRHFHINLADQTWCDEELAKCTAPRKLGVHEDKLWIQHVMGMTPLGYENNEEFIERDTGTYREIESLGGKIERIEGHCRRLPYMQMPQRAF